MRHHRPLLALAVIALLSPPCRAQCPRRELVTSLGQRNPVSETITGASVSLVPVAAIDGARYLRVRLELAQPGAGPWTLVVRDASFRPIHVFAAADFARSPVLWTPRVQGSQLALELRPASAGAGPGIRATMVVWMPDKAKNPYYSIHGQTALYHDLYASPTTSDVRRTGDPIGVLLGSFDRESWVCSGAMVAPDLFLTNWHCGGPGSIPGGAAGARASFPENGYWSRDIVRDVLVDLSWDGDAVSREMEAVRVVAKSKDLDFALLELRPLDERGPVATLPLRKDPVIAGETLRIVHHPEGLTKRITDQSCSVVDASFEGWKNAGEATEFTHQCDTEGGSSGAPVIDGQGRIAGLHHLGFEIDPNTCQPSFNKNRAVRIDRILQFLEANAPEALARLERK